MVISEKQNIIFLPIMLSRAGSTLLHEIVFVKVQSLVKHLARHGIKKP